MGEQYLLSSRDIIGRIYQCITASQGNGWADRLGIFVPTDKNSEIYKWLGMSPALREWIGARQAKGLNTFQYEIINKLFESTLEFNVDDLRRDRTGQIDVRISDLVVRYNQHWNKLLTALIEAGSNTICYDGQYFFDSDHSEGASGTQKNVLTASDYGELNVGIANNPTAYELVKAFLKIIQHFKTFKDDVGEPLNEDVQQFMFMVPVNMDAATRIALTAPTIDTGTSTINNPLNDKNLSYVSNPRLTNDAVVYSFVTDSVVKPFILQEETGSFKIDSVAEGSELEFKERKHWYGIQVSRNAGFGFWQKAIKSILS